jgi:hypothetical protein
MGDVVTVCGKNAQCQNRDYEADQETGDEDSQLVRERLGRGDDHTNHNRREVRDDKYRD